MNNTNAISEKNFENLGSNKNSILLIDDCRDSLELHRLILELEGYAVSVAAGASEAFKFLDQNPTPRLILLDMQMDEMSGPDFLLLLEKRNRKVFEGASVIYHTANSAPPNSKAHGYIQKAKSLASFRISVRSFMNPETTSNLKLTN